MKASHHRSPPGTKPNYASAIISVVMVLLLLGTFAISILEARQFVQVLKERVTMLVELTPEINAPQKEALQSRIAAFPYVKPSSVTYITKEEGLAMLKQEFGNEFMQLDMSNPLYDIYTFNLNADDLNETSVAFIKKELKTMAGVHNVYYQEGLVDKIGQNLNKFAIWALGLGLFTLFISFVLIHNTMRLSLYSNRFLIKNMELVGATWEFISRPYLRRSAWHGLLSGLIAVAILIGLLYFVEINIPEWREYRNIPGLMFIFAGLCLTGLIISYVSTFYVVNKYLRMRVDELY